MKKTLTLSIFLLFCIPNLLKADDPAAYSVDILEYGIYEVKIVKEMIYDKSPDGNINMATEIRLIESTNRVPAKIGLSFGCYYVVRGKTKNSEVEISDIIVFPPKGLKNPKEKKVYYKDDLKRSVSIGEKTFTSYTFESDWELVPGEWDFQIWYEGKKLGKKIFTVYMP